MTTRRANSGKGRTAAHATLQYRVVAAAPFHFPPWMAETATFKSGVEMMCRSTQLSILANLIKVVLGLLDVQMASTSTTVILTLRAELRLEIQNTS